VQNSGSDDERNVVPRWRAPNALAGWEIASQRRLPDAAPIEIAQFQEDLDRWRSEGSLEAAADIFAAGLIANDRHVIWEGGLKLIAHESEVEENLIEAVKRELTAGTKPGALRRKLAKLEASRAYVYQTIKMLKRRIKLYPRDPITALELARHYAILGQYDKSERLIQWAHSLAPNERIILRSMVQFYDLIGNIQDALPYIRQADIFKYDPLVQSAEIAASELSGKATKVGKSALQSVRSGRGLSKSRSELALAFATMENNAGSSERAVFKIVQAALANPTENATAQAIWLGEQSSRAFSARFPSFSVQEDAFEARAYLAFDEERFFDAAKLAYRWGLDQPMQAHPLSFLCTCIAVYLDDARPAIDPARIILLRHAGDWTAVNAALLAFVANDLPDEARLALKQLKLVAGTGLGRVFATAGEGLYEFTFGDPITGRESYLSAMRLAREKSRTDLVFSAAAFYVFCESQVGIVSSDEVGQAIATLDRLLPRVPAPGRVDAERLWSRLKQRMVRHSEESSMPPKRNVRPYSAPIPLSTLLDHLDA
jgi:tetratricopeptide (TPR) repeat protein